MHGGSCSNCASTALPRTETTLPGFARHFRFQAAPVDDLRKACSCLIDSIRVSQQISLLKSSAVDFPDLVRCLAIVAPLVAGDNLSLVAVRSHPAKSSANTQGELQHGEFMALQAASQRLHCPLVTRMFLRGYNDGGNCASRRIWWCECTCSLSRIRNRLLLKHRHQHGCTR